MSGNVKTQVGKIIGKTLNSYYPRVKPTIDDLKFKQEYQDRIIECMVGEVDDNYITTPETDNPIVKLEYSKEGLVKVPSIKGKTILVDADGNETDTPAEGCRLVSVGEDEDNKLIILSKNKNLFDLNIWKENRFGDNKLSQFIDFKNKSITLTGFNNDSYTRTGATGGQKPQTDEYNSLIEVKPNTTYTLSMSVQGSANRVNYIQEYDENYNSLILHNFGSSSNDRRTFTTKPNCKYIGFRIGVKGEGLILTYSNIQLEEKASKTDYINHESHKTEILLDEPLRKLPNGVCDEIVGNKIIRRIGVFKFDITKRFGNSGLLPQDKTTIFQGDFALDTKSGSHVYTEKLNVINLYNDTEGLVETLGGTGGLRVYFRISKDRGFDTPQKFEKYLYDLDPTILYELAEPIIEELPNGITLQGFDDTTMYIENSITPTVSYGYNALIPYKEELSQQKEEVEVNTLDIENNIIPYLMDMEFNLMLMEDEE